MNQPLVTVQIDRRLLVSTLGFLNRVDLKGSEALEFGAAVMALRRPLDLAQQVVPAPSKSEPAQPG